MKKVFSLVLILCSLSCVLGAQELSTSRIDTSTSTDSTTYDQDIYIDDFEVRRIFRPFELPIDTILPDTLQALKDIHRGNAWNLYKSSTGNSFSPEYSLKLDDPIRVGPRLGYDNYIVPKLRADKDDHFQSNIAITNLYYSMGSKSEQEFNGIHRHSLSPRFDFDVRLHKQNSPGFYSGEKNNTSYFGLQTYWSSKDLRWQNESYYRRINLQYYQNGGITTDTLYDSEEYQNLRLMPTPFSTVNLQNLKNSSNWLDQHVLSSWGTLLRRNLGQVTRGKSADSTQETYVLIPSAYFEWGLKQESQKYNMYYIKPDSLGLASIDFQNLRTIDTLGTDNRLQNYTLYMAYAKSLSTQRFKSNIKLFVDWTASFYNSDSATSTVSLGGELNFDSKSLAGLAQLQVYTAGTHAGDVSLDARIFQTLSVIQNSLTYTFRRAKAPLFYSQNTFNNLQENNNLDAETHQHLKWSVKYKWLTGGAGVHSYYNYIYAVESTQGLNSFENLNKLSNIYYASLGVEMEKRKWGTQAKLYGQRVPLDFPLSAPSAFVEAQIYLHGAWFDSRLKYYTGLDLSISSKYRASSYDLFYNNWSKPVSTTPNVRNLDISYFINFKVSRAKIFLRASQLNQLFWSNYTLGVVRDYSGTQDFNFIGSPNFNLRFGVSWLMIN